MIYEDEHGEARVSSLVADHAEFWWNERKPDECSLWQSKIELGEKFFNEIIRHPVPLNMNTLKALKRSSLGLDLYLWLTYRTFPLRAPLRLTWKQLYSQFGVHPSKASDKETIQNFRRKVLRELKKIKLAWPELNYSTAPGLLILHPFDPGHCPAQSRPATKLGSPFPAFLRPVGGLIAPSWTLGMPRATESSETSKSPISTGLCKSDEFSTTIRDTP